MKTKTCMYLTLILLFNIILILPNASCQDYTQWHLPEGAIARYGKGGIQDFVYFPDGKRLAVKTLTGHTDIITSMMYSPDGTTFVCGCRDGKIHVWNIQTYKHIQTLAGHTQGIPSIDFLQDTTTFVSGADDGTLRLWHTHTGTLLKNL